MLLCIEQIPLSRMINDEPVFESDIVVGNKLQLFFGHAIGAGLGEFWKRWHNFARLIDNALVRESLPFETASGELQPVSLVRGTGGLVNAFLVGTSDKRQHEGEQCYARNSHD